MNTCGIQRTHQGYRMGHSHHNAKLTEQAVAEIRRRHESLNQGYGTIGKCYSLSPSTIRDICNYRTWIHVH